MLMLSSTRGTSPIFSDHWRLPPMELVFKGWRDTATLDRIHVCSARIAQLPCDDPDQLGLSDLSCWDIYMSSEISIEQSDWFGHLVDRLTTSRTVGLRRNQRGGIELMKDTTIEWSSSNPCIKGITTFTTLTKLTLSGCVQYSPSPFSGNHNTFLGVSKLVTGNISYWLFSIWMKTSCQVFTTHPSH